jgi:hypothetical protein
VTSLATPREVRLRTYQVGFGDCFLLSLFYEGDKARHVLIDFGTTSLPRDCPDDQMLQIAEDIRAVTGGRLTAVVATHRHRDHVSGFATLKDGGGSGDIIRELQPELVVQPWTEDPAAPRDWAGAGGADGPGHALAALEHMHLVADAALRESQRPGAEARLGLRVRQELAFLGQDNIKNRSAVENLLQMGEASRAEYLHYGMRSGLEDLLPGVSVRVLGPPTMSQWPAVRRQRSRDDEEFWHLQAAAWQAGGALAADGAELFPGAPAVEGCPPGTRWFVKRMEQVRGQQLLSIVRALDRAMNNTSLILLFTIGRFRLLFPGDAQIENWLYALEEAPDRDVNRAELAKVDVYKVGHHGSLNATPKKLLWDKFARRKKAGPGRLCTLMSTMPGKHGKVKNRTEVPRRPLVDALEKESDLTRTDTLKFGAAPELCHKTIVDV